MGVYGIGVLEKKIRDRCYNTHNPNYSGLMQVFFIAKYRFLRVNDISMKFKLNLIVFMVVLINREF